MASRCFLRWIAFICTIFFSSTSLNESQSIRRVKAHLLIEDYSSAFEEALDLVERYPNSFQARSALIEVLSIQGMEFAALDQWEKLSLRHPDLLFDRALLDHLSWAVLQNGLQCNQNAVRLASLIGVFLTQDVRAVSVLKKMMSDSNAMIRAVAVQMACSYQDAGLKDEIIRLTEEEKVWLVRLEVLKAVGALRIQELAPKLQATIQNGNTTYEERQIAIEALVSMYDTFSPSALIPLFKSDRAGIRHLACSIASHFEIQEVRNEVCQLIQDPHAMVRIAALNAFGLFYGGQMNREEAKVFLDPALLDSHPAVAITASWAAVLLDPQWGLPHFSKWMHDPIADHRRLSAAALSATGDRGSLLAYEVLKNSSDPYVKANLALGLLGQRQHLSFCCDELYSFLIHEDRMWMWDTQLNPLFRVLAPSQIRHVDHIPNYPNAIDQMTRLNLLSLLALVEDPRALDALKSFLQQKSWGITGVAAATLLQEGDSSSLSIVKDLLNDKDPNIRLQACLVLAMFGRDESVLTDLQNAYLSADHEKKLHILEALGKMGNGSSYHFLVSVLKEPFPILRVAAAAALIQSLNR